MELIDVNSSNIRRLGYDEPSKTLIIVFKSGSAYEFADVPKEIYEKLLQTPSIGTFFTKYVRDKFTYKKIT
ncbi:MAG TPA: KTSC domain-containing protein [Methanofastidiosum sp.]|nr:KTSC domain-containing protein [Methanofastidiosum sp.]